MKRKGAPAKEGKCPRDAPKDKKCDNCRSKKGACQFAARIAAANATLSPDEPSTSEQASLRRIQSGEIVCVANHDVETKSCLPFLIGQVRQTPLLAFGDPFFKLKR